MLLCCVRALGQHGVWERTLFPGAAKMMVLVVNARSVRAWGKFGLSRMSLGLKLLESILGNKDVVSAGVQEPLQSAANGVWE